VNLLPKRCGIWNQRGEGERCKRPATWVVTYDTTSEDDGVCWQHVADLPWRTRPMTYRELATRKAES
jgi:hypothetical protein